MNAKEELERIKRLLVGEDGKNYGEIEAFYKKGALNASLTMLIADEEVKKQVVNSGYSHDSIARSLLQELGLVHGKESSEVADDKIVDHSYSQHMEDFKKDVTDQYHCVYIGAVKPEIGETFIYCPVDCTAFQLEQLELFCEEMKKVEDVKPVVYVGEQKFNNLEEALAVLKEDVKGAHK